MVAIFLRLGSSGSSCSVRSGRLEHRAASVIRSFFRQIGTEFAMDRVFHQRLESTTGCSFPGRVPSRCSHAPGVDGGTLLLQLYRVLLFLIEIKWFHTMRNVPTSVPPMPPGLVVPPTKSYLPRLHCKANVFFIIFFSTIFSFSQIFKGWEETNVLFSWNYT